MLQSNILKNTPQKHPHYNLLLQDPAIYTHLYKCALCGCQKYIDIHINFCMMGCQYLSLCDKPNAYRNAYTLFVTSTTQTHRKYVNI